MEVKTTFNLILIRHAKSSWEFNVKDFDRPLTQRGIDDANLVFKQLSNYKLFEYDVWCSNASRTKETAKIFSDITGYDLNKISFKSELYTFEVNDFINSLNANFSDKLIIFGHNPAITDFVNKFGDYYIENVPTCGVVILKFDTTEKNTFTKGKILKTIFPKDLK